MWMQGMEGNGSTRLLDSDFDMQMAREMQQLEIMVAQQEEARAVS